MTRLKRVIAMCAICLLLCGCSSPLSNCKVADKVHREAYVTYIPIYSGKTVIIIPRHCPEAWYLTIEGENKDGDICRMTRQVDEATYEQAIVGQEWVEESE